LDENLTRVIEAVVGIDDEDFEKTLKFLRDLLT